MIRTPYSNPIRCKSINSCLLYEPSLAGQSRKAFAFQSECGVGAVPVIAEELRKTVVVQGT
ncbi:MAG: hypothetical protein ACLUDY_10730 [Bacteroides xylanisolvens]